MSPVMTDNDSIVCSDKFYVLNNTCRPKCADFESYTPKSAALILSSQIFAASFGLFMGIIVLLVSLARRKIM